MGKAKESGNLGGVVHQIVHNTPGKQTRRSNPYPYSTTSVRTRNKNLRYVSKHKSHKTVCQVSHGKFRGTVRRYDPQDLGKQFSREKPEQQAQERAPK